MTESATTGKQHPRNFSKSSLDAANELRLASHWFSAARRRAEKVVGRKAARRIVASIECPKGRPRGEPTSKRELTAMEAQWT